MISIKSFLIKFETKKDSKLNLSSNMTTIQTLTSICRDISFTSEPYPRPLSMTLVKKSSDVYSHPIYVKIAHMDSALESPMESYLPLTFLREATAILPGELVLLNGHERKQIPHEILTFQKDKNHNIQVFLEQLNNMIKNELIYMGKMSSTNVSGTAKDAW
jgi:hypothetical protein